MSAIQNAVTKQRVRIFLSYSLTDKGYVSRLRNLLSKRRDSHVFSPEFLSAGEDFASRIKDEIARCDIFVVLLSSDSINSKWVLSELGAAWALNKLIIPVFTQSDVVPKIPLDLSNVQSVGIEYLEDHPEVIDEAFDRHRDKQLASYNPA